VTDKPARFVVIDAAHCYYEPIQGSAVSFTPPYGSSIHLLDEKNGFGLVEMFMKKGWLELAHTSELPPPDRLGLKNYLNAGVSFHSGQRQAVTRPSTAPAVEIGPRGGRFTRTKDGYRRYF
jgi:hypothetical protein